VIRKAQALLITITVLSVLAITGFSLLLFSLYEVRYSRIYLDNVKAQYLAEAGLTLGRELLKQDKKENFSDSLEDSFYTQLKGEDLDLDKDGIKESRYFEVKNFEGRLYGRFGVQILDEASKLNLNYCGESSFRYGLDLSELNINSLFSFLGISKSTSLIRLRRGSDEKPGLEDYDDDSDNLILISDGIDNDLDGVVDEKDEGIDEPDEEGFGDDRLFLAPEETREFLTLPSGLRFRNYFTVYSKDKELDSFGRRRIALSASFQDVLMGFLSSGVRFPFQKAANFIDFQDKDLSQTVLDKFYKRIKPVSSSGGSFRKSGNYFYAPRGGAPSTFKFQNLNIPDGEYFCFFYSPFEDLGIGYVSVQDIEDCDVYNGEGLYLPVKVEGGELEFRIKPFEDRDCALEYIELVSPENREGLVHTSLRGRESLVINEVMIKPSLEFLVEKSQNPGGSWVWKGGYYENKDLASGIEGEGRWVFSVGRRGYFYIKFFANTTGGYIGDVVISGRSLKGVRDGMVFPYPVYIDGDLLIKIQNNSLTEVSTFKKIVVSQEPDAEFIEILNITPREIDIGNFSIEVTQEKKAVLGWPAIIPQGTKIRPYEHLILAIDKDDRSSPSYLRSNGISFQESWGTKAVQLEFSGKIEGCDDIIPDSSATIALKNPQGEIVDIVEYTSSQIRNYVSLERSDPTLLTDADGDGIFDGWFFSEAEAKATPSEHNDNSGIKEIDPKTLEVFYHNVREQVVLNQPLINIGYAEKIPSSLPWKRFSLRDIALLSDRFTSFVKHLGISSFVEGNFKEEDDSFFSFRRGEWGLWRFSNIPQGSYFLKILAEEDSSSVSIAVKTEQADTFDYLGPFYFHKGCLYYGNIEIESGGSLEIKVRNEEDGPLKIINFILEPEFIVSGRININTARKEILNLLLPSNSGIISQRPFGERSKRRLGIGDLLETTALGLTEFQKINNFKLICPFITTRSDVYEVITEAEYSGVRAVKHRLETVIER